MEPLLAPIETSCPRPVSSSRSKAVLRLAGAPPRSGLLDATFSNLHRPCRSPPHPFVPVHDQWLAETRNRACTIHVGDPAKRPLPAAVATSAASANSKQRVIGARSARRSCATPAAAGRPPTAGRESLERWRIGIVHERREEDMDGRLPVRAAGAMDALPRSKHAFVLPVMNKLRVLPTPLRCVAFSPPTLQRGAALPLPLPPPRACMMGAIHPVNC